MASLLTDTEINAHLSNLPGWELEGKAITRTFKFKNFVEAINFVNNLVEPAEAAGHHPDLSISYNKVTVTMTTHDAGGLTEKDFQVAQSIELLK